MGWVEGEKPITHILPQKLIEENIHLIKHPLDENQSSTDPLK